MSSSVYQTIPRIIHQTWRTERIRGRWVEFVSSVKSHHSGWDYRLWTDEGLDHYVKNKLPEYYPVFSSYPRPIMRADAIRYIMMRDFGGVYCDLDYEFIRPYDYSGADLILGTECCLNTGNSLFQVANFFFASAPGHPFWQDVIDYMRVNPPKKYDDVVQSTGPGMLTRVWLENCHKYDNYRLEPKLVFSPFRIHKPYEKKVLLNNGITYGIHHGSGSWKDRLSLEYWRRKLKRWLNLRK
ncbi:MAG: glycosyltransferase family 32 protein [Cellvibrionaceae bacterium]